MEFEWDPDKNDRNIARRGIDFAWAIEIFQGPMTVKERDIVRVSLKGKKGRLPHRTDLKRVRATTDADIERDARTDPDAPPIFDDWFDKAMAIPPAAKVPISIRIDPDVLEFFRDSGPGYQSRMNAVLRAFMEHALRRK